MKKTLTAAAVCAVISPIGSLALVSGASAADTNVSLGGYVRGGYYYKDVDAGSSTGRFEYRGRLQLDAKSDNGVRGTLRLQGSSGDGGTSDANDAIDRALIQYNGFRFGYTDSFHTTFHGYGNFIERQDGDYGFHQAFLLDYTGSAGGFSYGIGLQDRDFNGGETNSDVDPYFGVGFGLAGASIKASFVQDTDAGAGEFKLSANYSLGGAKLKAWFRDSSDANKYGATATNDGSAYGASASFSINDAMSIGLGYSANDDDDTDLINASLKWAIVPGLSFRPEIDLYGNDDVEFGFRLYRTF